MDLNDYRLKLDKIDDELLSLFAERMNIAADIAAWKRRIIFLSSMSGGKKKNSAIWKRKARKNSASILFLSFL